jgi:type 1 glutamine amidotransferase
MKIKMIVLLIAIAGATGAFAADKKLVLIAGRPSHGPGEHEHRAGCLLFQKCLTGVSGLKTVVYENGWPTRQIDGQTVDDNAALEDADAVVIYSDGEGNHPALVRDHMEFIGNLIKRGVGFGCIHYAVEPSNDKGQPEFLEWIGGAYEQNWSVNPSWQAEFKQLPVHAVTRGVKPFTTKDEWYFHLRFRPGMSGVTPILTAIPPVSTMSRPDGAHSGNPAVRAAVAHGEPQPVMWVTERDDGGRGFGFSGGHYHSGWKNNDQRKLMLNTLLWVTKVPVPEGGAVSTISEAEMKANLDLKPGAKP